MASYPGFARYTEQERGFRGWLVFFFVTSCIGACLRTIGLVRSGYELQVALATPIEVPLLATVVALGLLRLMLFVVPLYGLLIFARGDRNTPFFWAAFLLGAIVADAVLVALAAYEATLLNGGDFGARLWAAFVSGELPSIAVTLLWVGYWMRSTRVRLTFGRNAFTHSR